MEGWFKEVGKPALFDALAGVCDRIDNEFDTSIRSYKDENARLSAELARAKNQASDVFRLKEENQCLRRDIQHLKDTNHANDSNVDQSRSGNDIRTPLAPRSVNQVSSFKRPVKSGVVDLDGLELSELKEHYLKLQGNFTKLHEKYLELEGAHTELNKRLRATTRGYNQWKDHANEVDEISKKRSQTIKKLKAKLAATAAAASGPLDASFSSDAPVPPAGRRVHDWIEFDVPNEPGPARPDQIPAWSPLASRPTDFGPLDRGSTTSPTSPGPRTTYNGAQISQRRDTTPNLATYDSTQDAEDVSTLPPLPQNRDLGAGVVRVKDEPSSDIPVVVSERSLRKRKYDGNQTDAPQTSVIKREGSSEPLITDERRHFVPHESIDFDVEGGTVRTPRKRNRPNPRTQDGFILEPVWTPQLRGGRTRPTERSRSTNQLLSDENLEDSEGSPLSEHGIEPSEQQVDRPLLLGSLEHNAVPQHIPKPMRDGDNNLPENDGTPASRPFGVSALRKHQLASSEGGTKTPSGISRSHNTSGAPNRTRTPGSININQKSRERTAKTATNGARPLRERPRSELCITDFKVNPAANSGYDYAFTEVVRNKDDRATLTGCIDEDCCGPMFRLQARAMRGQTGPTDFQALLEKYMGDEAWKLSTMSKQAKEDLWVDAKMRELSNEIGRHRHRYHRAPSPAGFWRMDFPSTQEEQQDREEAARMVSKMVDERYREAMRPGGRWLFRDE